MMIIMRCWPASGGHRAVEARDAPTATPGAAAVSIQNARRSIRFRSERTRSGSVDSSQRRKALCLTNGQNLAAAATEQGIIEQDTSSIILPTFIDNDGCARSLDFGTGIDRARILIFCMDNAGDHHMEPASFPLSPLVPLGGVFPAASHLFLAILVPAPGQKKPGLATGHSCCASWANQPQQDIIACQHAATAEQQAASASAAAFGAAA